MEATLGGMTTRTGLLSVRRGDLGAALRPEAVIASVAALAAGIAEEAEAALAAFAGREADLRVGTERESVASLTLPVGREAHLAPSLEIAPRAVDARPPDLPLPRRRREVRVLEAREMRRKRRDPAPTRQSQAQSAALSRRHPLSRKLGQPLPQEAPEVPND